MAINCFNVVILYINLEIALYRLSLPKATPYCKPSYLKGPRTKEVCKEISRKAYKYDKPVVS